MFLWCEYFFSILISSLISSSSSYKTEEKRGSDGDNTVCIMVNIRFNKVVETGITASDLGFHIYSYFIYNVYVFFPSWQFFHSQFIAV